MNYTFSDKVSSLQPSAIREILKVTSLPGFIPLAAGNPSVEAFPIQQVNEISARLLSEQPVDALQYSVTEGYTPLREHMLSYMKQHHGVGNDSDGILITSGAQQVMDLSTKVLCNEGDTVICEAPSFIGSLNSFRSYNVNLVGINMQDDGMDIEQLEHALKTDKNVRFIYTIPNFQNPTGITMSLEKRKQMYELASKYGVMILEDNPYGDIRFSGKNIPSIKSLDTEGLVIYAGSFSKVLSPGMRVGYAIAPTQVLSKLIVCKQVSDVHTNIWSQIIAYRFMTEYSFEEHLENIRGIYRAKARLMMDLIDRHLGDYVTYVPVEGGLFIWCRLIPEIGMLDFVKAGIDKKVAVVPGTAFMVNESDPCNSFRVNYSTPSDEQIKNGIAMLGDIAKQFTK